MQLTSSRLGQSGGKGNPFFHFQSPPFPSFIHSIVILLLMLFLPAFSFQTNRSTKVVGTHAILRPGVNFINILQAALHQYFCTKKLQSQTVIREKLRKALSHDKRTSIMLMKLTKDR